MVSFRIDLCYTLYLYETLNAGVVCYSIKELKGIENIFMKICGLQKTTLLDFPGHVAATVFLNGCNFRCPFCHNTDLLTEQAAELMTEEQLLDFLKKRNGVLEGVCISGGEPTLSGTELERLIDSVKNLGYLVKLDTNGYRPGLLKKLCSGGLLDYAAMDIKAGRFHYGEVCGTAGLKMELIEESADFLMQGTIPYEFRTTVVRGLHDTADFEDIARWIGGCSQYYLQGFVDSGNVLKPGFSSFTRKELEIFLSVVQPAIPAAAIRGVDY